MTTSWFQSNGYAGVDLFFGISGFLICTRLFEDERFAGQISLRNFYYKACIPHSAFCLLHSSTYVSSPCWHFSNHSIAFKGMVCGVVFLPELQFFERDSRTRGLVHRTLLAPLSRRAFLPDSPRRPGVLAEEISRPSANFDGGSGDLLALLPPAFSSLEWLSKHTDTRLGALLIPAILAVLLASARWKPLITLVSRFWLLAAVVFLWFLTYNPFPFLTPTAESILVPIVILGPTLNPTASVTRILEFSLLRWFGKISYSLYLWQQIFFCGHFPLGFQPLGFMNALPFRWIGLFSIAAVSYYLIEKPAIRLGHRLTGGVPLSHTEDRTAANETERAGANRSS